MPQFVFIFRRHHDQTGEVAQIGQIKKPLMGRSVFPDNARAVHGKNNRKILQTDIVQNLIVGSLQESRINRHDGRQSFGGQARGKGHGQLFGDADIVKPAGMGLAEFFQPRALAHGRRDGDNPGIGRGQFGHCPAENFRVGRRGVDRRKGLAGFHVKGRDAVVGGRIFFREFVAPALLRDDVDQHGAFQLFDVFKVFEKVIQTVPLQGADIGKPQLLEQGAGNHKGFHRFFDLLRELQNLLTDAGNAFEEIFQFTFESGDPVAGHDSVQIGRESADVWRDGHFVVV